MDLTLSEEQEMLKKMARDFLEDQFTKEAFAGIKEGDLGYSPEIWKEMVDVGWTGLVFPEEYGGADMVFLDLAMLLEEMGRARCVSPFFSTLVLGGLPILDAGSEEQKKAFLPKIADGEAIFTLALTEHSARYDASSISMKAAADKDGYVLNGAKLFVPYAHISNYMLCVARTNENASPEKGITVFIVEAGSRGISCTAHKALNDEPVCEVVFNEARVPKENILGRLDEGWDIVQRAMDRAAVAKCCEMVGGAQKVLEMTVAYAKERKQFNRPIGSFQSIQHHCSNMLSDVDSSKVITYEAAWKISEGLPYSIEAAMAKSWVSDAYRRVTMLGHQIHGGVGLIEDHDMPQYFKRAKVAEVTFGDAKLHRKRLAKRLQF